MFKKIFLPLDNSSYANYGIKLAVELGKKYESRLVGSHVYAARLHEDRFKQMEDGLPEQYQAEEELERQRDIHADLIGTGMKLISDSYYKDLNAECEAAGVKCENRSVEGKNFEELVKEVKSGDYDLVVMGVLGLGEVEHSRIGTVCERVVRQIRTDCLVVREERLLTGNILVAVDGSPESFRGLKVALELSRTYGSKVDVVSVFDPDFHTVAFDSIAGILSQEAKEVFRFEEQEQLHDEIIDKGLAKLYKEHLDRAVLLADDEKMEIETHLLAGKPYDEIIKFLEKKEYSLLFVGRHGIHTVPSLDMGGNTDMLIRQAPCSVYIASEKFQAPELKKEEKKEGGIEWDDETLKRLERVPSFARGMARKAIEDYVTESGHARVTDESFNEAIKKILPPAARMAMGIES